MRSDKISIALMDDTLRSFRRNSFTEENFVLEMNNTAKILGMKNTFFTN